MTPIVASFEVVETVLTLLEGGEADAPAVEIPDGGRLTYQGLRDAAGAVAAALVRAGISAGDRVALSEPDGPEFLQLLFGVLAAGAAAAPLNSAYTEDEFAFYLDDLKPRALLLPADALAAARAAAASTGVDVLTVAPDGGTAPAAPGPDDMALLLHTSGTTSRPKQVPLLHRNLSTSARTIAATYGLTRDDVAYCAMPLFHVHGLVASVLATLSSGGTVVVPRRFTPRGLLAELGPHGVTWVSAGPTTYAMVLERDEKSGLPTPTSRRAAPAPRAGRAA